MKDLVSPVIYKALCFRLVDEPGEREPVPGVETHSWGCLAQGIGMIPNPADSWTQLQVPLASSAR
jgi:hypothetical protein